MTHYYQNYYRPREINLEEMQQQIQTAKDEEFKPCIVIPCYRHVEILINRLPNILRLGIKIIVVDDGKETLFGEAYRILDGKMELICSDGESIILK